MDNNDAFAHIAIRWETHSLITQQNNKLRGTQQGKETHSAQGKYTQLSTQSFSARIDRILYQDYSYFPHSGNNRCSIMS